MLVTVNDLDWEKNIFEVNNVLTWRQWHYYKGRHEKNFRENLPLKCNNTTWLGCCITRIPVVPRSAQNPSCKSNNTWFIRQRAFIEIWSTREVWRVRKMRKSSRVLSKLPKCFIFRWTHSWRRNQLFNNIFNPMENFFLEGFVCWRHERAQ